jgi:MFS family permease
MLHTVVATRIRGLLMMLCGVFLMAMIGYISIWMLDVIYDPGSSKAQFTGTRQEKLGIFALFAGIIIFGLGSFLTGAWQAAFGRRNKTLSWIVVGLGILIFVGGSAIVWLLE